MTYVQKNIQFVTDTQTGEDELFFIDVDCRDVDNGVQVATMTIRGKTVTIDNTWIVQYSPILLLSLSFGVL